MGRQLQFDQAILHRGALMGTSLRLEHAASTKFPQGPMGLPFRSSGQFRDGRHRGKNPLAGLIPEGCQRDRVGFDPRRQG